MFVILSDARKDTKLSAKYVFISYNDITSKTVARRLKFLLEKKQINVKPDIDSTDNKTKKPENNAVEKCLIFVPILSTGYELSGNCMDEFNRAIVSNKQVIAVQFENDYTPKLCLQTKTFTTFKFDRAWIISQSEKQHEKMMEGLVQEISDLMRIEVST